MSIRLAARTIPVLALVLASPLMIAAQQADRAGSESLAAKSADRRLQALQQEADQLAAQERTLLGDLRKLELDRRIKAEELERVTTAANDIAAERDGITAQIDHLETQERTERPELEARLVDLYKLRRGRYLHLLFSASDLRRLGQATRMVAALAVQDRQRVERHEARRSELETTRRALDERSSELERLRQDAVAAQTAANGAVAAHRALISRIDQQRDLNAKLAGELQAAQARLQQTLRAMDTDAAAAVRLPGPIQKGAVAWPADGAVRLAFGEAAPAGRASVNGVEIAAVEGSPVRAVHPGTVAFAGVFTGFGNLVIIDHGGRAFSLYGNLLDVDIAKGARIDRGQVLGSVGAPPVRPAGLYFELRIDGRPVDPVQWLEKR